MKIPIDIVTLCSFLDYLCSSIIFARRLTFEKAFHGLTLPRSWILSRLLERDRLVDKDTRLAYQITEAIGDLLIQLHTSTDVGTKIFRSTNPCSVQARFFALPKKIDCDSE
jgi:hypothetical protein